MTACSDLESCCLQFFGGACVGRQVSLVGIFAKLW